MGCPDPLSFIMRLIIRNYVRVGGTIHLADVVALPQSSAGVELLRLRRDSVIIFFLKYK